MRVGVVLDGRRSAAEIAELAGLAETHGFSHVWLSGGARTKDHFVRLALAAAATRRIRLGPIAVSPFEMHPVHIGLALLPLDEIAPGRGRRGPARAERVRAEQLVRVERPGNTRGSQAPGPPPARVSPLLHPRRRVLDRPRRGGGPRACGKAAPDAARDLQWRGTVGAGAARRRAPDRAFDLDLRSPGPRGVRRAPPGVRAAGTHGDRAGSARRPRRRDRADRLRRDPHGRPRASFPRSVTGGPRMAYPVVARPVPGGPNGGRMIKLDHLTIAVTDCEKSRNWYIETLGLKLEFEIPERRTSAVQDEFGFTLFLAETPGGPGRPSCVLTFQVSDVEAKHRQLVAAGVKFVHPPQKTFWGYGADLKDPDGYHIWLWDEKTMREKGEV